MAWYGVGNAARAALNRLRVRAGKNDGVGIALAQAVSWHRGQADEQAMEKSWRAAIARRRGATRGA
jgi:hypothetical protein